MPGTSFNPSCPWIAVNIYGAEPGSSAFDTDIELPRDPGPVDHRTVQDEVKSRAKDVRAGSARPAPRPPS